MRYIRNEDIQPSYLVPVPVSKWTEEERLAGASSRKQKIEPINVAQQLYIIAISAVGQGALSEKDIRSSINLQDAIDPDRKGEPSVKLGDFIEISDDAHEYLVKKLDARQWFSLECREILEMLQDWRNAPSTKPLVLDGAVRSKRR